ncbi:PREDICTED: PLAC8 [Prunus dulcis]|uniref:PREDICTED: PLAC8 n=1 Tax=Prunus dulcis TaxID=3755 RepID=A0A5E4EF32_PRUDU|nr:PREDICTED: PLAC8 [Prunus dulcis]
MTTMCLLSDENHRRDEISGSVPSSKCQRLRECFNGILAQKIDWASMSKICKKWIKNPLNMAILLWISCVAVSGAILLLVMTGMLNSVLPEKSERNAWSEINNQILTALFTLMALYQHPKRIYHLVLLLRWKPKDVSLLRKMYSKNGTYKPHEWAHIMVVVFLLHLNCFAQYALCGLNLGYKRSERPAVGVGICLSVAIAAPAIAGVYCIVSVLGKEYEVDHDAQDHIPTNGTSRSSHSMMKSFKRAFSFASRDGQRISENAPQWRGDDKPALSPLPRESGITEYRFHQTSLLSNKPTSPSTLQKDYHSLDRQTPKVKEESTMEPPVPLILQREENIQPKTQKGRNY